MDPQGKCIHLIVSKTLRCQTFRFRTAGNSLSLHGDVKQPCYIQTCIIDNRNLRCIIYSKTILQCVPDHKCFQLVRSSLCLDHILKFFTVINCKWLFFPGCFCLVPGTSSFSHTFLRCLFHLHISETIGSKVEICICFTDFLPLEISAVTVSIRIQIFLFHIFCPFLLGTGFLDPILAALIPFVQSVLMAEFYSEIICVVKQIQPSSGVIRLYGCHR